jgi:hypothetical protein
MNASAGLLALVLQLRFEHSPTGIEHRFGHSRLCQLSAAHVANDDPLVLVDDFSGKLVQGIFAPPRGRAVQTLGLTRVSAALRLGDSLLDVTVEMPRRKLIPVARRHRLFETQIEPHCVVRGANLGNRPLGGDTEPPVADRILREAAAFPFHLLEQLRLEDAKRFTRKA